MEFILVTEANLFLSQEENRIGGDLRFDNYFLVPLQRTFCWQVLIRRQMLHPPISTGHSGSSHCGKSFFQKVKMCVARGYISLAN
jgi:hypothetical protein